VLKYFTLWSAIKAGGPIMFLLFACSIVSIAIILERVFYYHSRSSVRRASFMKSIRSELNKGDIDQALMICDEAHCPFSSVVAVGLNSSRLDEGDIAAALEREMIIETAALEKRTAIVGTIGSTAVYIGLLGTVWGIIWTCRDIADVGSGEINIVIGGISQALVCTAAGLLVAIPAVIAYNYFVRRINGFVVDMELVASEITSLIKDKKRSGQNEKNK